MGTKHYELLRNARTQKSLKEQTNKKYVCRNKKWKSCSSFFTIWMGLCI